MLFRDIPGNPTFKTLLTKMINSERLPHATMFSSHVGGGSLAYSLALSSYIMCEKKGDDACGNCPHCLKSFNIIHPDIKIFFPSESKGESDTEYNHDELNIFKNIILQNPFISEQDWREILLRELEAKNKQLQIYKNQVVKIIQEAKLKPMLGYLNIIIIWLPEQIHYGAIPKLLKLIEEPPEHTIFILATEDQTKIIPTILSRVQIFRIPPLKEVDLLEFLSKRTNVDLKKIGEVVNIADGNISLSLKLVEEQEVPFHFPMFQSWMRACYTGNIPEIYSFIQNLDKLSREQIKNFVFYSIHIFRETFNQKVGNYSTSKSQPHEIAWIKKLEPSIDEIMLHDLRNKLEASYYQLERNGSAKIIFLNLSLDISIQFRQAKKRITDLCSIH